MVIETEEEAVKTEEAGAVKTEDTAAVKAEDTAAVKTEDAAAVKKEDTAKKEEEPTDPQVLQQVAERLTFFFSHANLRSDRFLQKIMARDEDFGGNVGVDVLLKFKSIQQHTTHPRVILEAARTLDFLQVREDSLSVREPMKKTQMDDNIPLSLHVEGLPLTKDEQRYDVSVVELKPIFEVHGPVALIKLKWKPSGRDGKRKMVPTGSCQVEYTNVEDAKKAAAAMLGDSTTIKEAKVTIQTLEDWIAARKAAKNKGKKEGENGDDGDPKKRKEAPKTPVKEFQLDWKKGCVIALEGLNASTDNPVDREAILAAAKEAGLVDPYADYSRGQAEGAIRCPEPSDAIATFCAKLASGEATIGSVKVSSAKVLEGEEEEAYWNKFIAFKNQQLKERSNHNNRSHKKSRRR